MERLTLCCHIEGVHETEVVKRLILLRGDIKLMLNVHTRNIVGHQQDFIAVEFMAIFRLEGGFVYRLYEPHDEVAGADEWIDKVNPCIRE